jgi:hypothetical protein
MAALGRNWTKALVVALLLGSAGMVGFAQSAENGSTGSLSGKLTDLYSKPLEGVALVLRNQASGVEARTTTAKNGTYRFSGLEPGEYTLQAESPQLGRGQVEEIEVAAGHEARVQTAMEFEPLPHSPVLLAAQGEARPKAEEQPKVNQTGLKPAAPPVSVAALPAKPLQAQPVNARLVAPEKTPAASAPKASATLAPELPRTPVQAGGSQQVSAPLKPAVAPPASAASIPATAASTPASVASAPAPASLHDSQVPKSGPGAPAGSGLPAVSGAIQTPPQPIRPTPAAAPAPAAPLIAQPQPRPVLAASQESGPAAPAVSAAMSAAELQALPVSGRRWQDFVLDNAATSVTPAGGQGQYSLRGVGQQPPEITVDGFSKGLAFGGTGGTNGTGGTSGPGQGRSGQGGEPSGMAQVGAGGHGLAVSEAAIREVQTAAGNVEAEADRAAGGRMSVETQHGANELHGQGFLFDRQNAWGARNPFTQWVTKTSEFAPFAPDNTTALFPVFDNYSYTTESLGPPESYTPPDRETVWGIGVGSRIRRDKLFWFAALDGYNRNDPGLAMVKHPYLLEATDCTIAPCAPTTTGFFAQPASTTVTTIDEMQVLCARLGLTVQGPPGTVPYCPMDQVTTDYSQMLETLAGLLGPAPRTAMQWTGFGRLDWQATERNRITLEGIGAYWNSPGGGLTRVSENYGNHSFGSSEASEEWLLGRWERFLTPNLLAVTQLSTGHSNLQARPSTPSDFEKTFLTGNAYGQLPEIVVDNRYGFTIGNPSRFGKGSYPDERLYHFQESVDWIRGKLLVKAGFELNHNFDATSLLRNQTGTYTYSNVENFISDALVFAKYGLAALNVIPSNPDNGWHNCDQTGKVWQDSTGQLEGGGYLPCYSYYSQMIGPADWRLSTNDWAGYATAQWQANRLLVVSAGLRWEREQLPPPIAALNNPELPLTEKLPSLGNEWGPRVSLAVGTGEKHWPLLRLGYGMYFGRTENAAVETALTQTGSYNAQTGSYNGDVNFFIRPTDGFNPPTDTSDAPPFPSVLRPPGPGNAIKPGAVEFAPGFHDPEVHQAVVAVEEKLPGSVEVTASAMVSLGRRLPISIDANFDPAVNPGSITYTVVDPTGKGPINPATTPEIKVPFYASWPTAFCPSSAQLNIAGQCGRINSNYQQITQIMSRANSTYEAWMVKVVRYSRRGLSLHAHYTYAHAMDWNPNESAQAAGNDVLDPANFGLEYGTSDLDMRHSAGIMAIYEPPWKLRGMAGKLGNGWMLSGVIQARSGLPYTMRTSGSLPEEFLPTTSGTETIVGLGPGMNGSGGDNRVYGVGSDGTPYNIGRNTYRYPATWKADLRLGRRFDLGHSRELELLAESFNLFNHQNVTELETTGYYIESGDTSGPPTLNFLTGLKANTTAFGQPLNINATNFYRERQFQFGLRVRF